MNNLLFTLIMGLLVGTIFFGGLWVTVKKAVNSKIPYIWFVVSFLLRADITLLGFYLSAQRKWQGMLVCLLGFLIAKIVIVKFTNPNRIKWTLIHKEVNHEA